MEGLMHSYAAYLRDDRITAKAIAPTLIHTDIVAKMKLPQLEQMPFGRFPRAEEAWPAVKMIVDTEYLTA